MSLDCPMYNLRLVRPSQSVRAENYPVEDTAARASFTMHWGESRTAALGLGAASQVE